LTGDASRGLSGRQSWNVGRRRKLEASRKAKPEDAADDASRRLRFKDKAERSAGDASQRLMGRRSRRISRRRKPERDQAAAPEKAAAGASWRLSSEERLEGGGRRKPEARRKAQSAS